MNTEEITGPMFAFKLGIISGMLEKHKNEIYDCRIEQVDEIINQLHDLCQVFYTHNLTLTKIRRTEQD